MRNHGEVRRPWNLDLVGHVMGHIATGTLIMLLGVTQ